MGVKSGDTHYSAKWKTKKRHTLESQFKVSNKKWILQNLILFKSLGTRVFYAALMGAASHTARAVFTISAAAQVIVADHEANQPPAEVLRLKNHRLPI